MSYLLNKDDVRKIISEYGYTLVSEFRKSQETISILDKEDYLYTLRFCSILNTLKNNRKLERFNKFNFSSSYNVYLWVRKNKSPYDIVSGEYYGTKIKSFELKCKNCQNTWMECWGTMLSGQGCPFCSRKRISFENSLLFNFPEISKEWDYSKNKLLPEDYFSKSNKPVFWICKNCENSYETIISNRTQKNSGCPKCDESKGERKIYSVLEKIGVSFLKQYKFEDCVNKRSLPFDFYIPEFNMCIEYQGEQHYRPVSIFGGDDSFKSQIKRDKIKKNYCKLNSIDLLIIPYWKVQDAEKIIIKRILQKGGI